MTFLNPFEECILHQLLWVLSHSWVIHFFGADCTEAINAILTKYCPSDEVKKEATKTPHVVIECDIVTWRMFWWPISLDVGDPARVERPIRPELFGLSEVCKL